MDFSSLKPRTLTNTKYKSIESIIRFQNPGISRFLLNTESMIMYTELFPFVSDNQYIRLMDVGECLNKNHYLNFYIRPFLKYINDNIYTLILILKRYNWKIPKYLVNFIRSFVFDFQILYIINLEHEPINRPSLSSANVISIATNMPLKDFSGSYFAFIEREWMFMSIQKHTYNDIGNCITPFFPANTFKIQLNNLIKTGTM